jgi:glutamyl-tRNA synthetase
MSVRTRFAPSPTGFMHLGGMRTALFNWLYARKHGGQFILRIDDTDQARHQDDSIQPILDAFKWLGLDYDEGPGKNGPHAPYFQSKRKEFYDIWYAKLLDAGFAYKDYSTADEREADRKDCEARKVAYRFREKEYSTLQMKGRSSFCVRLRVQPDKDLLLNDLVRGLVAFSTNDIPDFVLVRADDTPLYNFTTVVDDANMCISHVIRSEEHLANSFVQMLLYDSMGFAPPQFAHLPYVAKTGSKVKMSKRDQGAGLSEYFDDYLPEAFINYLARLGWSLDGETTVFALDELIEKFTLERVVKAPASHDPNMLFRLQDEWMRREPPEDRAKFVAPHLVQAGLVTRPFNDSDTARLIEVVEALGDRLKKGSDIIKYAAFFFKNHIDYESEAVKKRLQKPGVKDILEVMRKEFSEIPAEQFESKYLEEVVHRAIDREQFVLSVVINAVRVAVTGCAVGPGLYDILAIFGQDEVVRRMDHTLSMDIWKQVE